eukprot:752405-Hanusia_phi.AAC.4
MAGAAKQGRSEVFSIHQTGQQISSSRRLTLLVQMQERFEHEKKEWEVNEFSVLAFLPFQLLSRYLPPITCSAPLSAMCFHVLLFVT